MASLSYSNVLRLLADEIEAVNQLEEQIKEMAPKVEAVNRFVETEGEFTIRSVANAFGISVRFFFQYLREKGIITEKNEANHSYCKQGYLIESQFSIKQKNGITKTIYTTHITPAGMVLIYKMLWNDGYVTVDWNS